MKLRLVDNNNKPQTHQVFRFVSDSQKIRINFSISDKITGYFPHVGLPAQEGLTLLFRKTNDEKWYNLESFTERFDTTLFMNHLVSKGESYEVMIYGPILNTLENLEVESFDGSILEKRNVSTDLNLLIVGGLTSHGIGCTTSGMTFPNILARKMNASVDYATVNDKNYMRKVSDILAKKDDEYDFGLLEVDYSNQDDEIVKNYLKKVLVLMSSKCKKVVCWSAIPEFKKYKKSYGYHLLKELEENNIYWVDYSFLHDDEHADYCTYSGHFINDSGNVIVARKLEERIRSL